MAQKNCTTCNELFLPTAKVGRDFSYCPSCRKKRRQKQWHENKKTIQSANHRSRIKNTYGLSKIEYELKKKEQDGKCAICESENGSARWPNLSIDHDHSTGKVRGLLCHTCNSALGMFRENKEVLLKAIKYLERYK